MSAKSNLSLTTLAIRRHIGTLMLAIAVVVMGFYAIFRMPVDLLPSITYPRIGVRADAPGVVPAVAVNEITRPLEEALAATEGVTQIFSQTREGRISIDLFFQPGADVDQALNDTTATLNRARNSLPDNISQPRVFKFDPSQLPVYEMALTSSTLAPVDLRIFADNDLARELIRVPGVANVDISGGVEEEIQVNLDLERLQALGLDVPTVLNALGERNQDASGGLLRGGDQESLTRLLGQFNDVTEIRNLPIRLGTPENPQIITLQDVAEITDGTVEERLIVTLNGQPAVKVSVQKQPDANTVQVVDGVKAKLAELQQSGLIPADMDRTATLDESVFIRSSIQNVAVSGLTGATLAAIAVLLFLGSVRQTLIIVLSIPLATLTALILMFTFNLSLNVFSLGGLALGVGVVVDNAIVMLENITAGAEKVKSEHGSRRKLQRTVEASSQELESALFASTTTNLVSVLPFLLVGGFLALIFSELILTISFSVAASLVIALTVVPALSSRLLAVRWSSNLQRALPIQWFGAFISRLTTLYSRVLGLILRRKLLVIAGAIAIFGGSSLWMVGQLPQEILPRINTGQAELRATFPPGTTVEENRRVMQAVEDLLLAQPETEYVFTTSGGALFGSSTVSNALRGSSSITLKPGSNVQAYADRVNRLIAQEIQVIGTSIRMRPGSVRGLILSNSPSRADVDVMLQGANTDILEQAGAQVLAALESQATLASYEPDAAPPQPEVQIRPDWQRAAALGLSAEAIGNTIQTALDGSVPTQLQRGDRLVDIRVQLEPQTIQRAAQLRSIPLFTSTRQPVQLGDLATITSGDAPGEIQRINQRQVLILEGNLVEGASLSEALTEVNQIIAGLELPAGVSLLPSSAAETNRQIQLALQLLGGMAAFLVFVVMAVQYNSLIDPLVIMLTVPLALAGGILGLFITQTAIGATVIVGAVLLVGIVVNNAIIMVELANQIRERDRLSYRAAILEAAPQRLRPILMTTITTVLGLFPLALGIGEGSEFLQPLGIVVFSGLSLATVLTLFIIPCFYTLLHELGTPRTKRPRPVILDEELPSKILR
ncbi:cation transporter [Picosynechococcus sp. PCC 7003]|uniref:efflux RND transporter permease subunit n=1 Tax=Picosynechococcus sp. PCC 7003 TaxID=374981 RepID=UPI0008105BA4|nr:efflux RND transporter permease subunit [Picosynechococcus sp. PCC 7003]ANV83447.1 cation transporter [Picosynechococcus sp. PCC 7003]